MSGKRQFLIPRPISGAATAALVVAIVLALTMAFAQSGQAQTFTVIHTFNWQDGALPLAGLTMDAAGDLYGTTYNGGSSGNGTVFRLRHFSSGWVLTTLHSFVYGDKDGAGPASGVALAQDGTLYGTTEGGGLSGCGYIGCGTVFHLKPSPTAPKSALESWNLTVLYRFTGGSDGGRPEGDLTFDRTGNIYGTTYLAGYNNGGVIYELTPSGGGWTESVLYSPQNSSDGGQPAGGVIFDPSGDLYGVFSSGGPYGWGAVYELSPSGSGWIKQTLYGFHGQSDGGGPAGGVILDPSGNLYGTTNYWQIGGPTPTVFELTPGSGSWNFNLLYTFLYDCNGWDCGPKAKLAMDSAGNLYGTTVTGAYGYGSVFKLTPANGVWTYTSLHDFTGNDGASPSSNLVFDANGNLYGTTSSGGGYNGWGVVFEITP